MHDTKIRLEPIWPWQREQFILDNQEAFNYGALEEFGKRDEHYEEGEQIISRQTIEASMDAEDAETYRIILDDQVVGGMILKIDPVTRHNHLEILFVSPKVNSKGIGYAAWQAAEALHPETEVWETCTPYFEKRNIHFYVNKCGFHIVEFFCGLHPDPHDPDGDNDSGFDGMFRFEKRMKDS